MANVFNSTLNITQGFIDEIGSQTSIMDFIRVINNDMNQIPALMFMIVVASVILISLLKNNQP